MQLFKHPQGNQQHQVGWPRFNLWDALALGLVIGVFVLFAQLTKASMAHYVTLNVAPISLDPIHLPYYALRSVFRMLVAMLASLLFTFIFGTWAARSRFAERVIIPIIDVLQSVPVLGFLPIFVVGFVALFPHNLWGIECASIFTIFTAQVWNMTLSFYQSLCTVPTNLYEASRVFQLSSWQRFWRIEVPFAMPGLLWNAMMSMSASWVFLVASEAISVFNTTVNLPGIGSYIALAIQKADTNAVMYVIMTMVVVIFLYDQLLFRPLVAWAEKFKAEDTASQEEPYSWLMEIFNRASFCRMIGKWFVFVGNAMVNLKIFRKRYRKPRIARRMFSQHPRAHQLIWILWNVFLMMAWLSCLLIGWHIIHVKVQLPEVLHVGYLGLVTGFRVFVLIILSSILWVPVGVFIGLRVRVAQFVQPILQFLAAFPANLLYPIFVIGIIRYHLNVNIWVSPLMILGTQWYILFNVIAGTLSIPRDMQQAVHSMGVRGWVWWRKFILPAIFPFYMTGAITAAGGAWNMSIIAEAVSWGSIHLQATGIGAYVDQYSNDDMFRLALGVGVMTLFVVITNQVIWRPLYELAQSKYKIK
jgi:NitT/TauT family transport system permease protein